MLIRGESFALVPSKNEYGYIFNPKKCLKVIKNVLILLALHKFSTSFLYFFYSHLFFPGCYGPSVADQRGLSLIVNPPTKKKADVSDALNTLVKANVVTPVQRSHLDSLFSVANNCAHPKEAIRPEDVERLITDGRRLASAIL